MFKKVYIKLGLVVVLLLATVLSLGVFAQAADGQTYTVTVTYDENCKEIRVFYKPGDTEGELLQNGVPKEIPKGTPEVRLELKLHDGWDVHQALDNNGVTIFEPGDPIFIYGVSLTENKTIDVKTKPKVYNINYIRTTQSWEGTADIGNAPTVHTYQADTVINNPKLVGYDFVKWLILPADPAQIPNFDPNNYTDVLLPSNTGYVILPATKLPSDPKQETFYLYPVWSPYTYEVKAVDVIYSGNPSEPFGGYLQSNPYLVGLFPAGNKVQGNDAAFVANGVDHLYNGFYFDEEATLLIDKGTITVMANNDDNVVYRYYSPYTYKLEYGCGAGSDSLTLPTGSTPLPTDHTYNKPTVLSEPILEGYTFAGWKVEAYQNGVWVDVSAYLRHTFPQTTLFPNMLSAFTPEEPSAFYSEPSPDHNGERVIRITALWDPKEFKVNFDMNGAVDELFPSTTYIYNTDLVIQNPSRTGYTFLGWTLTSANYQDQQLDTVDGAVTLPAKTYVGDISLVARWKANTYEITFDGNGTDIELDLPPISVEFDSAIPLNQWKAPTRTGHEFKGFSLDSNGLYMIIDENGSALIPVWNIADDTVLFAQWSICSYSVSVIDPQQTLFENAVIRINGELFDGTPRIFQYGSLITVEVVLQADANDSARLKLIRWKGSEDSEPQPIAHASSYTYTFYLGAHDTELSGVVAPLAEVPQFKVDYLTETLVTSTGKLPDGTYRISYGSETVIAEVSGGTIYITKNGKREQSKSVVLDDAAFDSAMLSIVVCGNGVTTADSDTVLLPVEPRPAAPVRDAGGNGEIQYIYPYEDTKIIIQFTNPADGELYEFACAPSDREIGRWYLISEIMSENGTVMFEDLKPGTPYDIYIRKRAVADVHPHGKAQIIRVNTTSDSTIEAKKQELDALRATAEGDVLRELIDRVKNELDALGALGASPEFESRMNAILSQVSSAKIAFARNQDLLINNLTAYYQALVNSGCFNETGLQNLKTIYTYSVLAIKSATTGDNAQLTYDVAVLQMSEIRVAFMVHDVLKLTSLNSSLPQGLIFRQSRLGDIENLIDSVYTSVEDQKIAVNRGYITAEEAQELLETLQVLASYTVDLLYTKGNVPFADFDPNGYEFRLTIPANLLEETGLQAAYYDEKTGVITLLETKREGNELVFYADRVEDFMILGTEDLTYFLIAMFVILLMQLIAIAILLASRKKNAEGTSMNAVALMPTLLAVRFSPSFAMPLFLILCALVIVAQIYLIYLIKTSKLFHRDSKELEDRGADDRSEPDRKRATDPAADEAAAMLIFDEPYDYDDAQDGGEELSRAWSYEDEDEGEQTEEPRNIWSYDPETGEVFESDTDDANEADELPVEDVLSNERKDAEKEETEEVYEDEIYIEPDITGDTAPSPGGYYEET